MQSSRKLLYNNDIRFITAASHWPQELWAKPSLCAQWTNHEVLAHLALGYQAPLAELGCEWARHGASFDRANAVLAQRLAQQRAPVELLAQLTTAMSNPRGLGRVFPRRLLLGDHVIHELDIRFAAGLESAAEPAQLIAVLTTQVRLPNPFIPSKTWARGLALHAEDVGWTHGAGPDVRGTAAHLASVLAGRPWALRHLSGDGVEVLRARLA